MTCIAPRRSAGLLGQHPAKDCNLAVNGCPPACCSAAPQPRRHLSRNYIPFRNGTVHGASSWSQCSYKTPRPPIRFPQFGVQNLVLYHGSEETDGSWCASCMQCCRSPASRAGPSAAEAGRRQRPHRTQPQRTVPRRRWRGCASPCTASAAARWRPPAHHCTPPPALQIIAHRPTHACRARSQNQWNVSCDAPRCGRDGAAGQNTVTHPSSLYRSCMAARDLCCGAAAEDRARPGGRSTHQTMSSCQLICPASTRFSDDDTCMHSCGALPVSLGAAITQKPGCNTATPPPQPGASAQSHAHLRSRDLLTPQLHCERLWHRSVRCQKSINGHSVHGTAEQVQCACIPRETSAKDITNAVWSMLAPLT